MKVTSMKLRSFSASVGTGVPDCGSTTSPVSCWTTKRCVRPRFATCVFVLPSTWCAVNADGANVATTSPAANEPVT